VEIYFHQIHIAIKLFAESFITHFRHPDTKVTRIKNQAEIEL